MNYINGCINSTALTYLCNLVGTYYELPEDDAKSVETSRGSIIRSNMMDSQLIVLLLVHLTK